MESTLIQKVNPYTASTDEIKSFLGNFERDLNEFYQKQPESRQSWEWYLQANRAITGGKIAKYENRERLKSFAIYAPNLKFYAELELKRQSLATLKDRRDFAQKQELRELEKSAPPDDEIDVSQIPFT